MSAKFPPFFGNVSAVPAGHIVMVVLYAAACAFFCIKIPFLFYGKGINRSGGILVIYHNAKTVYFCKFLSFYRGNTRISG
mgnify:CR=1 FL=1